MSTQRHRRVRTITEPVPNEENGVKRKTIVSCTKAVVLAAVCGIALTAFFCSNPSDVRWKSTYDFPISNKKFNLAKDIQEWFGLDTVDNFYMLGINDTTPEGRDTVIDGDTTGFAVTFNDTATPEIDRESLDPDTIKDSIGPIPLQDAPQVSHSIGLSAGNVPAGTSLNAADNVTLTNIYTILFHANSAALQVDVTNSTGTTIDRLVLGIGTHSGDTIRDTANGLAPNATQTLEYDMAGRRLDSIVGVRTELTFNSGATITAGDAIDITFSMQNMTASGLTALDSVFSMSETYSSDYEITDSMKIDYIDIEEGFFRYKIMNRTGLPLQVEGVHNGLWITSTCIRNNVDHRDSLFKFANATDSSNAFSGYITVGTRNIPPQDTIDFGKINISKNRMLPFWNDSESVTRVSYALSTVAPTGRRITLSEHDSFKFIITPVAVNFNEMLGMLTETRIDTADTSFIEIPFPWNDESKDSLRGSFILKKAIEQVESRIALPEGSFLDSLDLHLHLFHPDSSGITNDTVITLTNVRNDSTFVRSVDITDIVNTFPDSVGLLSSSRIAKGTRVRIINNQSVYEEEVGGMTLNTYSTYAFKAFFDWRIDGSATLDLGYVKFGIDDMLKKLSKIEEKEAVFHLNAGNYTNVHLRLFALMAPDTFEAADGSMQMLVDTLDTISVHRTLSLISDPAAHDSGYINLFGTEGVYVPPRDSAANSTVRLTEEEFSRIANADTCAIRWLVRFLEDDDPRTAMHDSDYIQVDSWIHLEGINSVDSLFSWGDE